jgi:hypothetical protein
LLRLVAGFCWVWIKDVVLDWVSETRACGRKQRERCEEESVRDKVYGGLSAQVFDVFHKMGEMTVWPFVIFSFWFYSLLADYLRQIF